MRSTCRTIIAIATIAIIAGLAGVPTAAHAEEGGGGGDAEERVTHWKLLGDDVEDIRGCEESWQTKDMPADVQLYTCPSFRGPGDWKGVPASVMVAPDDEIVKVMSMQSFPDEKAAKARATSLARHFKGMDACTIVPRSDDTVIGKWSCKREGSRHHVKITFDSRDLTTVVLSYSDPEGLVEALEAMSAARNRGL